MQLIKFSGEEKPSECSPFYNKRNICDIYLRNKDIKTKMSCLTRKTCS